MRKNRGWLFLRLLPHLSNKRLDTNILGNYGVQQWVSVASNFTIAIAGDSIHQKLTIYCVRFLSYP